MDFQDMLFKRWPLNDSVIDATFVHMPHWWQVLLMVQWAQRAEAEADGRA
jgi:hypothetical protein